MAMFPGNVQTATPQYAQYPGAMRPPAMPPAPPVIPAMPGMTYLPVIRQVAAQPVAGDTVQLSQPAAAPAATVPATPELTAVTPETPAATSEEVPAALPGAESVTAPAGETSVPAAQAAPTTPVEPEAPKSFAEETGEKVGKMVTQLIENNPQLEDKLQNLQLDNILEDPNSFASKIRDGLQGSRLFRTLLRFDKRIVSALPAEYEPTAREIMTWLKGSSPSPSSALNSDPSSALSELV